MKKKILITLLDLAYKLCRDLDYANYSILIAQINNELKHKSY